MYQYASCFMIPWAFSSIVLGCHHKINLVSNVSVCVYTFGCECGDGAHTCTCVCGGSFVGQKTTLTVIRIIVDPFREGLSLVWCSPVRLTRLGSELQGWSCLHRPTTGIIYMCTPITTPGIFTWTLGNQTHILLVVRQVLCSLSHSPNPKAVSYEAS